MYISFQDEGTMGKDWRGVIVSAVLDVSARNVYIQIVSYMYMHTTAYIVLFYRKLH
jgi:hypothetical protein